MLSLKADNPPEVYAEIKRERTSLRDSVSIDDLPEQQREWLRA